MDAELDCVTADFTGQARGRRPDLCCALTLSDMTPLTKTLQCSYCSGSLTHRHSRQVIQRSAAAPRETFVVAGVQRAGTRSLTRQALVRQLVEVSQAGLSRLCYV